MHSIATDSSMQALHCVRKPAETLWSEETRFPGEFKPFHLYNVGRGEKGAASHLGQSALWTSLLRPLQGGFLLNHSSSDRQTLVPAQFQLPLAVVHWTVQAFFTWFISKSSWQRSCLKGSASEHTARTVRPRNICDSHIHLCSDSSTDTWEIVSKADAVGKAISRRKWKIKVQTSWFSVMSECCAMPVMQLEREAGLSWVTRLMAGDTFCSGKSFNSYRLWASLHSSVSLSNL